MAMCGPTLRTAPTGQIVERELHRTHIRNGRKMQGKRSGLSVIGWQLVVDTTLGQTQREALRRLKELQELLRHVGKCGERHDDGFVAPIVAFLYDHEGYWSIGGCGLQ
jgi:hypothetical protein